jgi:hypothetical protein
LEHCGPSHDIDSGERSVARVDPSMRRANQVPHPDVAQLTGYAMGENGDTALEWHVGNCAECATEVAGLRSALDLLRLFGSTGPSAGPDCLDEHAVAAFGGCELSPPERDAVVAHLEACAHCRQAVASVASALSSRDVREEITLPAHPGSHRWVRLAIPLGAAAALAFLLLPSATPVDPPTHRSSQALPGSAPVAISPSGPTTTVRALRWHAVAGADRYQVTLFDGNGSVLWESTLADTVVSIPDGVALEPGEDYYWIVTARTGFDRWETSALVEFSIAGGTAR